MIQNEEREMIKKTEGKGGGYSLPIETPDLTFQCFVRKLEQRERHIFYNI